MASRNDDESRSHSAINAYKVLGVSTSATQADIKHAFRQRAIELHPDKNPGVSEELFKNLVKAYELLGDKVKRREYNEQMEESESDCSFEDPIGSLLSGQYNHRLSMVQHCIHTINILNDNSL